MLPGLRIAQMGECSTHFVLPELNTGYGFYGALGE
jgi:hypothetical protein